jgi:CheY-like chemotaxis protein
MDRQELLEELKSALAHLNDVAMLSNNPLAQVILQAPASGIEMASRGVHLRGLLIELIESMQPSTEVPENAPEWRRYLILRDRYVLHRPLWEIQNKLVIGDRQVRREHSHGLAILAEMLQARFPTRESAAIEPAATPAQAIQRLTPVSRVFGLAQLVEEVLSFLVVAGRLTEAQSSAHLHIVPDDLTVCTDPGVLRQLLTQLFLVLIPRLAPGSAPALEAFIVGGDVSVTLSVDAQRIDPEEEGLQLCQLLAGTLGAELQYTGQSAQSSAPKIIRFTLPPGSRLRKVLVIDDELAAVELYQSYAVGLNYQVLGETNPEEAVNRALEVQPDVIMLDVMMPAMDGWELLQRLRHTPELRDVPVIVCSVLGESDLATALNAAAFLKKPILRSHFVKTLNHVVK